MKRLTAALVVVLAVASAPLHAQEEDDEYRFPDVPFVVTPMGVVEAMLDAVEPTPADTLYDLGSGDGRIPIMAAARYGAHGVGIELQDTLVRVARRRARSVGVEDRVRFVQGDLFEAELSPATIVSLYLFQHLNIRLRPKLLRELRPGARVVSHHFHMGEWAAEDTISIPGHHDDVYFWIVPANVAGTWRLRLDGEEMATLEIEQRFQELRGGPPDGASGEDVPGAAATVRAGRVRGDSVFVTVEAWPGEGEGPLRLRGVASGDRMEGVTEAGRPWTARRLSGRGQTLEEWGDAGSDTEVGGIQARSPPASSPYTLKWAASPAAHPHP